MLEDENKMWILCSLMRPHLIHRIINSYAWGSDKVILALYEKDPRLQEYLEQKWPDGWRVEIVPMLYTAPTYNEILRRYPNERFYAYLADDVVLNVQGMLRLLARDAGDWNIAYANDKHWGKELPTMPAMGGDLVRAVGYLAPPTFTHWAVDTAWGELGKRLGNLVYRDDLTYDHLNPVWGTAEDDKTYHLSRQASFGWQDLLRAWMLGGEMQAAIKRVQLALEKAA